VPGVRWHWVGGGMSWTQRSADLDDTVRLLLMSEPRCTVRELAEKLKANGFPEGVPAIDLAALWTKYRGFDGRRPPTHDVATGERLGYRR
jgi:hypothetical protein